MHFIERRARSNGLEMFKMDTKNAGLEKVTPLKTTAFCVSIPKRIRGFIFSKPSKYISIDSEVNSEYLGCADRDEQS